MLATAVPNLDRILGGGVPDGDVLLIVGPAGSGKTTLSFQMAFHHAAAGRTVLYVATVSEPPARPMSFTFSVPAHRLPTRPANTGNKCSGGLRRLNAQNTPRLAGASRRARQPCGKARHFRVHRPAACSRLRLSEPRARGSGDANVVQ